MLRCSPEEARRLAGEEIAPPLPEDGDFATRLAALLAPEGTPSRPRVLTLPPEAKPLRSPAGLAAPFWSYLRSRGLSESQVGWVVKTYHLHYATRGRDRYRIIIPLYTAEGQLVAWTARSIVPTEELRYKTLPVRPPTADYSGPLATKSPGQLLLGAPFLNRVSNPTILVVCEGPLDAIKVSALGRGRGCYGTCLFGLNISEAQALQLERLMARFRRLVVLLDPEAMMLSMRIRDQLTCLVTVGRVPDGVEDPGAFTSQTFEQFWNDNKLRELSHG